MRLIIGAIGRLKDGPESDLYDRYATRITPFGKSLSIGPLSLIELSESKLRSVEERKNAEASQLLSKLPEDSFVTVLDERGKAPTTKEFADDIRQLRYDGTPNLAFLLGGPDGHDKSVKQRANKIMSLGPMTLPHGLARVVLAEQIYRALTIMAGHPYHRE